MHIHSLKHSKVLQISTGCLSQFTYMIFSGKQAVIIDPLRHSDPYLKLLKEHDAELQTIFLTHIQADYVLGHLPLSRKTNANIVMGPGTEVEFSHYSAKDSEEFHFGDVSIKLLHTPGHTLESSCYLLKEDNKNEAMFTGDTLFLGDSGRPDLGASAGINPEELASKMFYSLQRIKSYEDELLIFPGHGAGSPCGKQIQHGNFCKLGNQKKTNLAMQIINVDEFIKFATAGLDAPPHYFFMDVKMNKSKEAKDSDELIKNMNRPLKKEHVKNKLDDTNTFILDTRSNACFVQGHIRNSISVPLETKYAMFTGYIYENQNVIIVADSGKEIESIMRLTRIGIDSIEGFLEGGISDWDEELSKSANISSLALEELMKEKKVDLIDVRSQGEHHKSHVTGVQLIPLTSFASEFQKLDKQKEYYVYCGTGIRSVIAQTFAGRFGYKMTSIIGGFETIKATKIPLTISSDN